MIIQQLKCDNCTEVKKEVNHWFAMIITSQPPYSIKIIPFEYYKKRNNKEDVKHLCGEKCVHEMITKKLPGA